MSPKRVHYRESQTLTCAELSDEQGYRISMRRRHNLAQHRWGIVQGLALQPTLDGVSLSAGFAVDGYGRELLVPRQLTLQQELLVGVVGGTDGVVDVWLEYHVEPGSARGALLEAAWLRLDRAVADEPVDPQHPAEVAPTEFERGPEAEPPDAVAQAWPVYLGRIRLTADAASLSGSRSTLELAERVHAALVGASIRTPAGHVWLQLGDEEAADSRCFALNLPDEQGQPIDRWMLDARGESTLRGRARLLPALHGPSEGNGHLLLQGTAPALAHGGGIEWGGAPVTAEAARAWQLYRTALPSAPPERPFAVDELRIETFHPGEQGDPTRSAWVLGLAAAERSVIAELLTVRSDGTVIVTGDLHVEGHLIEGAIPADLEDERFRDELLGRWTKGITLAGTEVDAYYELPLDVSVRILATTRDATTGAARVQFQVTITHSGTSASREVPIVSVLCEFRNDERLLVHSQTQAPTTTDPLEVGDQMVVSGEATLNVTRAVTLTVRVFALGVAQNAVEKSATAVFNV